MYVPDYPYYLVEQIISYQLKDTRINASAVVPAV